MKGLSLQHAALASVFLHAAGAVILQAADRVTLLDSLDRAVDEPVVVELVTVDDGTDASTVLDLDRPSAAREGTATATPTRAPRQPAISSSAATKAAATPAPNAPIEEPRSGPAALAMRTGRLRAPRPDELLAPPPSLRAPIPIDPLAKIAPDETPRSRLRHKGGGNYESDESVFVAKVRPDGTVDINDKANFRLRFNLPDKEFVGAVVDSWRADPYKHASGESEVALPTTNIIDGSFDATDAAMRFGGLDPYINRKLEFMDATREERSQIARKHKADALSDAARKARRDVLRVHRRTDLTASEKRRLYFELWDECLEQGSKAELEAAAAVRATIIGFVRKHYPEGDGGYGTAELRRLNQQRDSKAAFNPYAKTR